MCYSNNQDGWDTEAHTRMNVILKEAQSRMNVLQIDKQCCRQLIVKNFTHHKCELELTFEHKSDNISYSIEEL